MTAADFTLFWNQAFPGAVPLGYLFRHYFPGRWVRFHSLPQSRRYPENEADWAMLLDRQNTILEAVIGRPAPVALVTGYYAWAESVGVENLLAETALHRFDYTALPPVALESVDPEQYQPGDRYHPLFARVYWQRGAFDDVLREVAEDAVRCFWVSPEQQCLIAPYDGGLDVIVRDTPSRDALKARFRAWLSGREDGL